MRSLERRQRVAAGAAAAASLLLAACAVVVPTTGTTQAALLRQWGEPTSRYALSGGGARLEYATGPFGRTTWMVDLDAQGHVTQARQVLNEAEFLAVQTQAAHGLSREELLRALGRPGERRHGGWPGGEVWSWRYPTNDCLWFQASITEGGRVRDAAFGQDPACGSPADGHN
jgi:hypothetical protein